MWELNNARIERFEVGLNKIGTERIFEIEENRERNFSRNFQYPERLKT